MREILFRGKRTHDNEWIVGSLHIEKFANDEEYLCCEINQCDVYPETVGQYTGLNDKNGKKIFEGDILESSYDAEYPEDVCYEVVLWHNNGWYIQEGDSTPDRLDEYGILEYSIVVGNIHDNLELLKEREG